MNVARLLLGFSKLSKAEIKQFTTNMNQYLIASPLARRQIIKMWEEELHVETKRANS